MCNIRDIKIQKLVQIQMKSYNYAPISLGNFLAEQTCRVSFTQNWWHSVMELSSWSTCSTWWLCTRTSISSQTFYWRVLHFHSWVCAMALYSHSHSSCLNLNPALLLCLFHKYSISSSFSHFLFRFLYDCWFVVNPTWGLEGLK